MKVWLKRPESAERFRVSWRQVDLSTRPGAIPDMRDLLEAAIAIIAN